MAVATTSDSIPVVDLRLLSQSDINSLALSSPHSFNLDTLSDVVPKIDRSVFNESAGSRKQTYSRLPLLQQSQPQPQNPQPQPQPPNPQPQPQPPNPQSQPQSPNPPLPRRRGRPRLHPLPNPPAAAEAPPDLGRHDNVQIVSILKKLFEPRGKCSYKDSSDKEKKSDNNHNNNNNNIVLVSDADKDREARNGKGEVVDLAALMKTEDLFGPEIRRRTEGLWTEEQILGYMTGLNGQWASIRKKSKVVDAKVFGDGLPKGWKVLLGLKRKEKIVYLNCRRYIRFASGICLLSVIVGGNFECHICLVDLYALQIR